MRNRIVTGPPLLWAGLSMALLAMPTLCTAEGIISQPETSQPAKNRPELPPYLPQQPHGGFTLPPAPTPREGVPGGVVFRLKGVVFAGNTVFTDQELAEVAKPFLDQQVGVAELEELRYRLTRFYVDRGYVNSGAVIRPGQKVDNGVVVYSIEEGRLNRIEVSGNERLHPSYVEKRLWPDPERPFNTLELQERFQLLLQDPLIERLDGSIRPGATPGEGVLGLNVTRARPYSLSLIADNHRPPSTGAEGMTLAGSLRNLTGWGDLLDASFGLAHGADEYAVGFSIPINSRETRLSVGYSQNANAVVEEPLGKLDIESESRNAEVGITHPLLRSQSRTLEVGLTLAERESKTSLLGEPFSFSPGVEDGKSQVTVLRCVQSYLDRSLESAFALRSTFSFGVDFFSPTIHDGDLPDSRFVTWLVQSQYARRLGGDWGQVILRGDLQLANDRLLPLEQFAVGGIDSVRGYRENELVRDNGYVLSMEWRYPLWRRQDGGSQTEVLQVGPFVDCGAAWNKEEGVGGNSLLGGGLGLLWTPTRQISAELYWAHDFKAVASKSEYNLQDDGIYFRFRYNVF